MTERTVGVCDSRGTVCRETVRHSNLSLVLTLCFDNIITGVGSNCRLYGKWIHGRCNGVTGILKNDYNYTVRVLHE